MKFEEIGAATSWHSHHRPVTVCAWCHRAKVNGVWRDNPDASGHLLTHGICPECSREHFGEDVEEEDGE